MGAGGRLEASSMEAVHAREDIKLLAEQSLKALLALMAGVDFNTPILHHPQFVLQLFSIGRVAVHKRL